ncbi:hypothetical protein MYX76_17530 [Desulfobacterota bacterium AH_259_B03_O07]|nr:hypothetical protein [Desulfobacterota bacterium AH_259_B03_O07]
MKVIRNRFPNLPIAFKASPDVESMYQRYEGYLEGKEPLTSMAYMCLTIFEASVRGRRQASIKYHIHRDVLNKMGELTSTRGDKEQPRKAPFGRPLTPNEEKWILEAVKLLIKRIGQHAFDPGAPKVQITMNDLPGI